MWGDRRFLSDAGEIDCHGRVRVLFERFTNSIPAWRIVPSAMNEDNSRFLCRLWHSAWVSRSLSSVGNVGNAKLRLKKRKEKKRKQSRMTDGNVNERLAVMLLVSRHLHVEKCCATPICPACNIDTVWTCVSRHQQATEPAKSPY